MAPSHGSTIGTPAVVIALTQSGHMRGVCAVSGLFQRTQAGLDEVQIPVKVDRRPFWQGDLVSIFRRDLAAPDSSYISGVPRLNLLACRDPCPSAPEGISSRQRLVNAWRSVCVSAMDAISLAFTLKRSANGGWVYEPRAMGSARVSKTHGCPRGTAMSMRFRSPIRLEPCSIVTR